MAEVPHYEQIETMLRDVVGTRAALPSDACAFTARSAATTRGTRFADPAKAPSMFQLTTSMGFVLATVLDCTRAHAAMHTPGARNRPG